MPSLILNGKRIGGSLTNITMDLENLYKLDYDNKVDIKDEIFNKNTFSCSKCGVISLSFVSNDTNGIVKLYQHGVTIFSGQVYNATYNYSNQCIVDESEITVLRGGASTTINEAYFIPFLEGNISDSDSNTSNSNNYIIETRNPDYSESGILKQFSASSTPYTCPEDGFIVLSRFCTKSGEVFFRINNLNMFSSNSTETYFGGVIPVSSGDVISFSVPENVSNSTRISFYKNKKNDIC